MRIFYATLLAALVAAGPVLAAADGVIRSSNAICNPDAPTQCAAVDAAGGLPAAARLTYVDVTLALDTSAYTAGDVLSDTATVTSALSVADGIGRLVSVTLMDEDDQGAALDLYLMSADVSLGSKNSAPNISDADARNILAIIPVATGDYKDLGGVRVVNLKNLQAAVKAASGTKNLFVSAVNGAGTPTYTASGLRLRLGFEN